MTLTTAIRFVVPGSPVAKGRARSRRAKTRTGQEFIQTYTPADTRDYERSVAFEAKVAMYKAGRKQLVGPLVLVVLAYFPIPPSWPKWKQREARSGLLTPTGKPDWDNVGKSISDAMNGIVYADDSAIVDAVVRQRYSLEPRVEIEVSLLNPLRREEAELLEPLASET